MTWIKPSFLWMMYRSGWASRAGQERVVAVRISRAGFERALRQACLSAYEPDVHPSVQVWRERAKASLVRVQWDPERSIRLAPCPCRAIQIGLSGAAVHDSVDHWVTSIVDVTDVAGELHRLVRAGKLDAATALLPIERPYPLPVDAACAVAATGPDTGVPVT